jgi:hypothetical protein
MSRNVSWLAILSFGESWHNLHQADARPCVASYRTSRGYSCNPGTPALIKRRSSLHETPPAMCWRCGL